jgi:hypothetical protein
VLRVLMTFSLSSGTGKPAEFFVNWLSFFVVCLSN